MKLRSYVSLIYALTVPPTAAAALVIAGALLGGKAAGRGDSTWGELLWLWAVLGPLAAAGIQRMIFPQFEVILPPVSTSDPHVSSSRIRRMLRIYVLVSLALLAPLYALLCHASGWEMATAGWRYSGKNPIGHALAATAVEFWPFVLVALSSATWLAAISVVRTRELDLYWEQKSRER